MIRLAISSVVFFCALSSISSAPTDNGKLTLRIVHTNDMHARFEETSQLSGPCGDNDAKAGLCYGGFARIATLIREARKSATRDKPVLFLNAGDTYQGTKLYSQYKWEVVAKFLEMIRPDAASLGNHEFDDGVAGLVPFLNNVTFPVVTANLDLTNEPELARTKQLKNSTILMLKSRKIGIVGYLTNETITLSKVDNVRFVDEVTALRQEVRSLKSQGVDILVALGHSGYEVDKRIAREVEDLDLVIGGHTNTFLYNGEQPDSEKIEGPYPTVVEQSNGRKVYVVQAYAFTKYLGDVEMDFDGNGEITRIEGKPILVDSSIEKAQDVEMELKKWTEPLKNASREVIGIAKVLLQGDDKTCRLRECNFGNLITDAMIHYNTKLFNGDEGWTDAPIALQQSGGIRSSIGPISDDIVRKDDLMTAFPFGTKLFKIKIKGDLLLRTLEWSVHDRISLGVTAHGGSFLQVSGLQVVYNLSRPLNSRVVSVKTRCNLCIVPTYRPLDLDKTYVVLLPDYTHNGGDGYTFLKDLPYTNLNVTDVDFVTAYIRQMSPVYPEIEGRIKLVDGTENDNNIASKITTARLSRPPPTSSTNNSSAAVYPVPILLAILFCIATFRMF